MPGPIGSGCAGRHRGFDRATSSGLLLSRVTPRDVFHTCHAGTGRVKRNCQLTVKDYPAPATSGELGVLRSPNPVTPRWPDTGSRLAACSITVAALYERRRNCAFWPDFGGHRPPLQPHLEFLNGLLAVIIQLEQEQTERTEAKKKESLRLLARQREQLWGAARTERVQARRPGIQPGQPVVDQPDGAPYVEALVHWSERL